MFTAEIKEVIGLIIVVLGGGASIGYLKRRVDGNQEDIAELRALLTDHAKGHGELLRRPDHEALCQARMATVDTKLSSMATSIASVDKKLDILLEKS